MDKAILFESDIPYLAPEVVLFFKSETYLEPYYQEKSAIDFYVLAPLLSQESKFWLIDAIERANSCGHSWADVLKRV
jgi:hypothetical protein